ncbi:MAG: molybdopterin-dependent oxidoreductase [Lapillicoccus sp.]
MLTRRRTFTQSLPYAATGVLAALAGMATGHLVAGLLNPASSPVLAVGSTVIDATPTALKEFAIERFGTNDKLILLLSVGVVTVLLAAVAGALSRRRPAVGIGLILALVVLAGAAAMSRPTATLTDLLPAVSTGIVGVLVLLGLRRALGRRPTPGPGVGASRRSFLVGAAGVTAGAVVVGALGQKLGSAASDPSSVALPKPTDPGQTLPAGLEGKVTGISDFRTKTADFYRVDTNLVIPQIAKDSWRLEIDGDVKTPFSLTFDELVAMPLIERNITQTCVSNEVGGGYLGSATWLGVRLTDILDRAGVGSGADQLLSTAVDGFTISTPLSAVRDGRDAMVVVGMNGQALPAVHGFPARLITPGLYGYVGATKWLTRLTLTTYAQKQAYWTERKWATDAPIKTSARVDTPAPLSTIKAGMTAIGGVAWAQHRGVGTVEIQIDGGPWQKTMLGPDAGVDYWRQWYLPWNATSGSHTIAVRAVDLQGEVQTDVRAKPFPNGSSGIQQIVVLVA